MGITVTKKSFADMIGKSPRWVSNLIDEGMPARGGGRGNPVEIDTEEAIDWLIRREISKRFGDDEDIEEGSAADEDRQLKRVRREEIELRIEERKRLIGPVVGFEDIALRIAGTYASQLDGFSSRVAGELAAMDDPAEIRAYLHDETRQIRASTAEQILVEVRELAAETDKLFAADDGRSGGCTTDEDA